MTSSEILLRNIDYSMLKKQKNSLLKAIEVTNDDELNGLLHLIDEIQDNAVYSLDKDENEVFDLETE